MAELVVEQPKQEEEVKESSFRSNLTHKGETDMNGNVVEVEKQAKVEESGELTWNDFQDEDEETEKINQDDKSATDTIAEEMPQVQEEKSWWEIAAEKSGIEASDETDFISKVKPKTEYIRTDDDQLHQLQQIAKLSPEERVAAKLSQVDQIPDNLIEKRMKFLKDSDQFDVELAVVDNLVRTKIQQRTHSIKQEQTKLQAEQTTFLKSIEDEVLKTEKVFDMKVGKDADSISKWQKKTVKDIRNGELGKLVNDRLTNKDVNKLLELYQFLKYQDNVTVGFKSMGTSQANKKVWDEIENNAKSEQNGKTFDPVKDIKSKEDSVPSWRTRK